MGNKSSKRAVPVPGHQYRHHVPDQQPMYSIWYRHSGQPEIDEVPEDAYKRAEIVTYNDIMRSIGSHYITHMYILPLVDGMPPLGGMAPHLTHLWILGGSYSGDNIYSLKNLPELKVLQIWNWKNNTTELLDVMSQITSLRELQLTRCNLTNLPQSFSNLQNLEKLDIRDDQFKGKLPTVIYQLSILQSLNVWDNEQLTEIESDILKLSKLKDINCLLCSSLQSPPYAVCQQGLPAIKKYFKDIENEAGTEVTVVPVAILGNMLAGKTSLIRSLKERKRKLTFRQQSSPLDEATKVFNIEGLDLTDSFVKLIDYGGHQVYHIAYQLTLKQQCIPLIVVSLEQFDKLVSEKGPREATKQLCVDWLSHLYLACPELGASLLVFTHRDKLSDEEYTLRMSQLRTCSETIRRELLQEEEEWSEGVGDFCQILHLSDTNKPLFHPDDVFVLSKYENINTLQSIKERIERRCAQFQVIIPRLWEKVSTYIDEQTAKPFIKLSDVKSKFPDEKDMDIIVSYLHNSGKVLWFKNIPSLSDYVFHQTQEVVKVIALVFHHSEDTIWDERIAKFTAFGHSDRFIEDETYKHLVKQFREKGVMDGALLTNLLKTETNFTAEVAVELLRSFYIIHGPIQHKGVDTYIIPSFSSKSMPKEWETNGYIQLRADILFKGLLLPEYVYQLMTVAALRFYPDLTDTVKVAKDGVTRLHGRRATHLVHGHIKRKVTLQISTPVEELGASWQRLIEFTRYILDKTTEVWKATRPVTVFYCSHCLFTRADNADQEVDPSWFRSTHQHDSDGSPLSSTTSFTGIEPVACCNADTNSTGELTVPKPLRFPCYRLTKEETEKLKRYFLRLEQSRLLSIPSAGTTPSTSTSSQHSLPQTSTTVTHTTTTTLPVPAVNNPVMPPDPTTTSFQPVQESGQPEIGQLMEMTDPDDHSEEQYYGARPRTTYRGEPRRVPSTLQGNQRPSSPDQQPTPDDDSDLSDGEEYIPSGVHSRQTSLNLAPCRKERICRLYGTEKVYHMSDPVRGRILILNVNIQHQNGNPVTTRPGSEIDFRNLGKLFRDLGFRIAKSERELPDLTAERIYEEIEEETKRPEHHNLGMFGLVLMAHGSRGEYLLDIHNRPVDLVKVKDMMSSAKFPAMHGKPKLMIIQACASDDDTLLSVDAPVPPASSSTVIPQSSSSSSTATPQPAAGLIAADFYIMKASGESFAAVRSHTHGSWFINMLVGTFYKHACHRDVQSLFRIVQRRLGNYIARHPPPLNARFSLPVDQCTFTDPEKKLFLFPGFSPERRRSSRHSTH